MNAFCVRQQLSFYDFDDSDDDGDTVVADIARTCRIYSYEEASDDESDLFWLSLERREQQCVSLLATFPL